VLLINPWIVDFAAYDFWIKPLGLLYIGAVLRDHGYEVGLLDCMDRNHPALGQNQKAIQRNDGTGHFFKENISRPDILKHIPRQYSRYGLPLNFVQEILSQVTQPDVICVTSGMTYWYPGVVEMISILKKQFPEVPVVLGGIYATLCTAHAQEFSGADVIVTGEGEDQIVNVLQAFLKDSISYKPYSSLNDLPSPAYDLYSGLESAAVLTSRGCPFDCPFCGSQHLTKGYRRRDPFQIIDEIEIIHHRHGVRHFAFYDDALLIDNENYFKILLQELIERKIDVSFHTPNGIHPKEIDLATAELMKQAGFQTLRLSYETSNMERQKQMGFKVSDADLNRAVRLLFDAGFDRSQIGAYVLMGLPDQEIPEVLDSMCFVLDLGIKISLASYSPIPGTGSWNEAVQQGYFQEDVDPLLTNNSIFPMKSNDIPFEAFVELGTLSAIANQVISQKSIPLQNRLFQEKLTAFKNTWMN